jgi:hypothetical protein
MCEIREVFHREIGEIRKKDNGSRPRPKAAENDEDHRNDGEPLSSTGLSSFR